MAEQRMRVISQHLSNSRANTTFATTTNLTSAGVQENFKYTINNPKLTLEQRRFYEDNGYIIVKNLVPHHRLYQYRKRFADICNGDVPANAITVMKDVTLAKTKLKGEHVINKIQDFVHDEVLSEFCFMPQILDYVECFTGPNIMAMHTMLINKPPDTGNLTSRHPLHQDLHYFPFRPAEKIVCAWTAMEKVNRENGCLVAIPGSHKGNLLEHEYPDWEGGVNKAYHGVKGMDGDVQRAHLEMEKGDTVFFHPVLIHGSGANRTTGYRKAISCHYAASECEYIDIQGTSQEMVAKEVLDIAKKRGLELTNVNDYQLIWSVRSRLMRGNLANL